MRPRQVRDSRPGKSAGRTGCHSPPELWSVAWSVGSGRYHRQLRDSASTSSYRDFQCYKQDINSEGCWDLTKPSTNPEVIRLWLYPAALSSAVGRAI